MSRAALSGVAKQAALRIAWRKLAQAGRAPPCSRSPRLKGEGVELLGVGRLPGVADIHGGGQLIQLGSQGFLGHQVGCRGRWGMGQMLRGQAT